MGWNGKGAATYAYTISWKDYVPESKVVAFERKMEEEFAELVEKRFAEEFSEEIKTGEVNLTS